MTFASGPITTPTHSFIHSFIARLNQCVHYHFVGLLCCLAIDSGRFVYSMSLDKWWLCICYYMYDIFIVVIRFFTHIWLCDDAYCVTSLKVPFISCQFSFKWNLCDSFYIKFAENFNIIMMLIAFHFWWCLI